MTRYETVLPKTVRQRLSDGMEFSKLNGPYPLAFLNPVREQRCLRTGDGSLKISFMSASDESDYVLLCAGTLSIKRHRSVQRLFPP